MAHTGSTPPREALGGGSFDPRSRTRGGRAESRLTQRAGELGTALASGLRGSSGLATGFETAEEVLAAKGQLAPGVADSLRNTIEEQRRTAQLDLDQTAARRGLSGSSGSLAISGALQAAAGQQRTDLDVRLANEAEARKRGDLSQILGGLFVNPALSLTGAEQARQGTLDAIKLQTPSNVEKGLGLAAGVFGSAAGAGLLDRK